MVNRYVDAVSREGEDDEAELMLQQFLEWGNVLAFMLGMDNATLRLIISDGPAAQQHFNRIFYRVKIGFSD
jgi:hypothetical protein